MTTGFDIADVENYRRKIGAQGQEVIDQATYHKLTKPFLKAGGIIVRGKEAKAYLDSRKAYAAYFIGGNLAFIDDEPTVSDVLEEMFHAKQDRAGRFSDDPLYIMMEKREIEAQKYLLSVAEKYKIPEEQSRVTRKNLADHKSKLKELLNHEKGIHY